LVLERIEGVAICAPAHQPAEERGVPLVTSDQRLARAQLPVPVASP
jgi:hypothetical protein